MARIVYAMEQEISLERESVNEVESFKYLGTVISNTGSLDLEFSAWNIRTLQEVTNTNRLERRTALVCKELARFNIDVVALSETRLPEEGNIRESGKGYTIFWKGKALEEPRIHGVGFTLHSQLVHQHNLAPKAISERLMTVRIPITLNSHLTLISVYAPTMTSTDDDKAVFYTQHDHTIQTVPANNKLVGLGDFNARVGKDHRIWEGIIGRHGIGNCSANGQLLLGLCAEHQLVLTNTIFQLPKRHKTTWRHPRSKHWNTLDYVLTRDRDRGDVHITRSMPGAGDCWTDHRLLISQLSVAEADCQRRIREAQKTWWQRKAAETQSFATNVTCAASMQQQRKYSVPHGHQWAA
ncbi:craniofacial development protein 2-like [Palaemon carinicauda]|uniref:craniofacial development protein 2-like n=1 Tax=Palaemon carinicauda TaxID=392227 RepID=UPI0035B5812F